MRGEQDAAGQLGEITLVGNDEMNACQHASAIAILTEWEAFKTYDYGALTQLMAPGPKTLYDLRGILSKGSLLELPFERIFQIGAGWLR